MEISPEGQNLRDLYYQYFNAKNHTRYGIKPVPMYDGGVDSAGRKHKPVWDAVLSKIESLGVPLDEYVETVINDFDIQNPRDLASPRVLAAFQQRNQEDPTCRVKWDAEEHVIVTEITLRHKPTRDIKDTIRRVVRDGTLPVSPLVRYCFACNNGCEQFVSSYQEAAFKQYKNSKVMYDKFCSNRIPNWFKDQE